jgi:hypothetical protein
MYRITIFLIAAVMFSSCDPYSKEEYLERYKRFIDEVSENYKTYSSEQWEYANERYARFNNEWYEKFKNQFTLEEKLKITGYQLKYNGLRAASEIGVFYDEHLKDDMEELRTKVKYYVDNRMEDDLKKFLEEVKKTSKTLYEELKKVVEEIKKEAKNSSN